MGEAVGRETVVAVAKSKGAVIAAGQSGALTTDTVVPGAQDATAKTASVNCPATRKPYHVLLTASSGSYQTWQTRLFYYHYVKMKRATGPCSEVGGFTRLLTQPKGTPPDALASEMRTIVVTELNSQETLGFVVLNRPHSVLVALDRGDLTFDEDYLLITETDHLLLKPMPNLATPEKAVAYPFHYMLPSRNQRTIEIIRRFAGSQAVADGVQQVGPSPVLIHLDALRKLTKPWYDFSFAPSPLPSLPPLVTRGRYDLSFALKKDPAADAEFGWMLEM